MTEMNEATKPRKFAAKYKYKWQGWTSIIFGIGMLASGEPVSAVFGVILLVLGVYLLRGQGINPKSVERAQKKADKLQSEIESATQALSDSKGARAVVAYRNLENLLKSTKLPDYQNKLDQILADINFEKSRIQSAPIGNIRSTSGFKNVDLEVYRDWIISGQYAFDVDSTTRGEVHMDGAITIDAKGNKHDLRQASVNFVSKDWSQIFPINPNEISSARMVVSQLNAYTESIKPTSVTAADISKMIETILSNSGQPPAEKLKQLSDLRFQRLLSDAEFDAAKARILGI